MKSLNKRTLLIALTATALALFAFAGVVSAQGGPNTGRGDGGGSSSALTDAEIDALNLALEDEYKAWATYDQVIADFGEAAPFTQIRDAEAQHIEALAHLFDRYDVDMPENEWIGDMPSFDSVEDACEGGVQAEIDNAALYDTLFGSTNKRDLTNVFTNLQRASEENHLPAFEACDPNHTPDGSGSQNGQQNSRGQGRRWENNPQGRGQQDCTNPDGPQNEQNRSGRRGGWGRNR